MTLDVVSGRASVRAGLELAYEVMGDGPPLVLIMGVGAQMVLWDDDLCAALVERGFQVIRFDHRDIGRSSRLDGPVPRPLPVVMRGLLGRPVAPPYTLADMAGDVVALCDHLGHARVHVLGISMGGMIAQHLAFGFPERVASLASLMSTTGARRYLPRPRALRALLTPPGRTEDEVAETVVATFRVIGSPDLPRDDDRLRAMARAAFRHGPSPRGFLRQMAAIVADGDRSARLGSVRAPTVVLHGDRDPLVPLAAGRATARAIPGAWWRPIRGMGHDLPRAAWPTIVDAVTTNARR